MRTPVGPFVRKSVRKTSLYVKIKTSKQGNGKTGKQKNSSYSIAETAIKLTSHAFLSPPIQAHVRDPLLEKGGRL